MRPFIFHSIAYRTHSIVSTENGTMLQYTESSVVPYFHLVPIAFHRHYPPPCQPSTSRTVPRVTLILATLNLEGAGGLQALDDVGPTVQYRYEPPCPERLKPCPSIPPPSSTCTAAALASPPPYNLLFTACITTLLNTHSDKSGRVAVRQNTLSTSGKRFT